MRVVCCLALMSLLGQKSVATAAAQQPAPGNTCTDSSTQLPADQCAAWQAFYDSTSGDDWTGGAANCTKNDPCGCKGNEVYPVCDPGNNVVSQM